jgi:hypothetical protein
MTTREPQPEPAGLISTLPRLRRLQGCTPCMQKLERLGWAEGMAFVCHGARIGIRVNDPIILERLRARLPPGWKTTRSPVVDDLYSLFTGGTGERAKVRRYNLVYLQSNMLARTMDLDKALDVLESSLHFSVAVRATAKLFVHAGVVGWRGRAIVIPGRSMSGKTTLVHALVRAGATYYSDEYAVFDARGRVHPYPKPLSLREGADPLQRHVPVELLGGRPGVGSLPVGLVAVTRYQAGARWRPRVLSPGQAVLSLLNHTLQARVRPRLVLERLASVTSGAVTLKGQRGEAEEIAQFLLRHLETETSRSGDQGRKPSWRPVRLADGSDFQGGS